MTQIQQIVGVVGQFAQQQQHQQMQWQQQGVQQNPAVSFPGLGPHGRARKLIDTRFVKIPFFSGEGKDYEDWSFAFKRAMRAANRTSRPFRKPGWRSATRSWPSSLPRKTSTAIRRRSTTCCARTWEEKPCSWSGRWMTWKGFELGANCTGSTPRRPWRGPSGWWAR